MKKMILKIVISCLAIGAVTTGVYAYSIYDKTTQAIGKISVPEPVPEVESAKVKPITILLMGVDYRPETASMNSDVIMIASLNPDNGTATLVSLPRDLQMEPKGLPSRKANYYYPHFTLDNKETAFAETKKVFSNFMDIPIDYMITVDFDGFRQVVDLMGGLTLDVDMDMRYVDNEDGTDINLKKGVATLNGKQTLDFVRYRKSNRNTEESSDTERNQRQQQVLNELMRSLKSADGVAKLSQIIETVGNHIHTDVPSRQLMDLMTTYYGIKPENVNFIHLNGDWESPYIVVKDEDIEQARSALKRQLGSTETAVAMAGIADTGALRNDPTGGDGTETADSGSGIRPDGGTIGRSAGAAEAGTGGRAADSGSALAAKSAAGAGNGTSTTGKSGSAAGKEKATGTAADKRGSAGSNDAAAGANKTGKAGNGGAVTGSVYGTSGAKAK